MPKRGTCQQKEQWTFLYDKERNVISLKLHSVMLLCKNNLILRGSSEGEIRC
jgi:hypothetical protein